MTGAITLFIVDDDDVDAIALKREFTKHKISNPIVRATNGEEAIKALKNNEVQPPFVILLDLRMPQMDGMEFLTALRKIDNYKDTLVFILSTSQDHRDIANSYKNNIAGYFIKDRVEKEFEDFIELLGGHWKIVYSDEKKEDIND